MTRQEYLQVYCATQEKLKVFEQYYSQYVTPTLLESIPKDLLIRCKASLDYHYNDIGGYALWDRWACEVTRFTDSALFTRNKEIYSSATCICIYKQAIRQALKVQS